MKVRYDVGTKVWTAIFGLMVCEVIAWFALVEPHRNHPPTEPYKLWWFAALVAGILAPTSWLVDDIIRSRRRGIYAWSVLICLIMCGQVFFWHWAQP